MDKKHNLAIILFRPEIPPNTGNIIRLCANTGAQLHLVKPLGFPLQDNKLKRAGLDYHEYANVVVHEDWFYCQQHFSGRRILAIETCGNKYYHNMEYKFDDVLLFGSETKGLPQYVIDEIGLENTLRLPMLAGQRSLNLSNSVGIVTYHAWNKLGFIGGL
ncbi:MAG: yibK [Burkholderiales bacterium]|nr:yibK [Burkholderiales bacterium]MCE3267951.1 yibK [Burkholderiales bacterium]